MIFAHRGASEGAPENTMAAFSQAIEKKADGVELDVHLSADGKVVVIHDDRLDRTSDGTGQVAYMNYDELTKYDMAAKWKGAKWGKQRIPLLEEVIDLVIPEGLRVNIELKGGRASPMLADEAVRIVKEKSAEDKVVFSSFDPAQLERVRLLMPGVRRASLSWLMPTVQYGRSNDLWGCHPNYLFASKIRIDSWHDAGMCVTLWTVNTKQEMIRAMKIGADGIITNHPALAVSIREGKIR